MGTLIPQCKCLKKPCRVAELHKVESKHYSTERVLLRDLTRPRVLYYDNTLCQHYICITIKRLSATSTTSTTSATQQLSNFSNFSNLNNLNNLQQSQRVQRVQQTQHLKYYCSSFIMLSPLVIVIEICKPVTCRS